MPNLYFMKKLFTLIAAFALSAFAAVANATPITEPKDTVTVTLDNSNFSNKLIDQIAQSGGFQIQGSSDEYAINMVFNTTTTIAGTYTDADVYYDHDYFCLYRVENGNYTVIPFSNLLPNAVITGDAHNLTALIHYVGTDSVLYDITFTLVDPTPVTHETFTATNLAIRQNEYYDLFYAYYGVYCYDFQADNGELLITGVVTNPLSDNAYGTWVLGTGDISLDIYDVNTHEMVAKYFSGTITIANNGGVSSLTGNALFYGDVEYTFNVTGDATAVDNVKASEYEVYNERRSVVVNGAEGQTASLYDIAGRLVGNMMVNSDNARFEVPAAGVYVVRIDGQSFRIVVK